MAIEVRRATPEDVPELGRVCYEAFKDISESHGFLSDFASVEFAQQVVGMMVQREDVYSVGAFDGAAPRGSNFVNMWGEVAGIGPVSVDVNAQGQGIGRLTMQDVVAHARGAGYDMIRLVQDSFNMQSLALYASLGFDVKEPMSYLALSDKNGAGPNVRPATADDLDAMDELCRSVYRVSRRGECDVALQVGFPGFVLERSGRIAGYLFGFGLGHGVAESTEDMIVLMNALGANVSESHAFVPLRNGELYRAALAAGHRNQKVCNLMAFGPYEEPQGTYCPSFMF